MFVDTQLQSLEEYFTIGFEVDESLLEKATLALQKLKGSPLDERSARHTKLLNAHHSVNIEGVLVTLANVVSGEVSRPKTMVEQTAAGLQYAVDHPITLEELINIWKICVKGCYDVVSADIQGYRTDMVYECSCDCITHRPAFPERIEKYMTALFNYHSDNPLLDAIVYNFYISYVCPFKVANGRLARIMLQRMLDAPQLAIASAMAYNTSDYYRAFRLCETVDSPHRRIDSYLKYMLRMIIVACEQAELYQNPLTSEESTVIEAIESSGSNYTGYAMVCNILDCSPGVAAVLIDALCHKGFLTFDHTCGYYKLLPR